MPTATPYANFCPTALTVIETEALAIHALKTRLDEYFNAACHLLLNVHGRIIVTGMGKSGHIGRKIAATFASTGSPAFYIHPSEACHGDLGMVTSEDAVIAISNSGSNHELVILLPLLKRLGVPIIAMTGNLDSPLAKAADIVLDVSVSAEACPLGLAPTASTTCTLVMGDALAMCVLEARGFTVEDFAFSHPGGQLGRRLILKVADVMFGDEELPIVTGSLNIADCIVTMSEKGFGCTLVVDEAKRLQGIFTDGDLRRTLAKNVNLSTTKVAEMMTKHCKQIDIEALAVSALQIMKDHKITVLAVVDEAQRVLGLVHMHHLLRLGL